MNCLVCFCHSLPLYLQFYMCLYLCRYKENRYPENTERLVIINNSGLDAEVQFRFQHDTQATTYLLDPPTMALKPDQKQVSQHCLTSFVELI